MTTYRLFPATNGPAASSGTTTGVIGLSFGVTARGCVLEGFWWWVADASQDDAPQDFALWQVNGAGSGTYITGSKVTSGTLAAGWNYVACNSPVPLVAGQEYRAVTAVTPGVFTNSFSATAGYYTAGGAGQAGITNGPLAAYSDSGGTADPEPADGAQMAYVLAVSPDVTADYPSTGLGGTNWWLDVSVAQVAPVYPLPGPVRARIPQLRLRRGAGEVTRRGSEPVNDPTSGPPVKPLPGPVRARIPQTAPRGRVASSPGARAAILLTNSFEGGTSGNAVSAGTSGGSSGSAFDLVQIGASATNAFDSSHAAHGSLSAKIATPAGATTSYSQWTHSMGTQPTVWFRLYLFFTANPAANHRVLELLSGGSAAAGVQIQTSGKIQVLNAAGSGITVTTNTIPLNSWFRIEGFVAGSATAGQTELKLFRSPDAQVPSEVSTSAAAQNTAGGLDTYRFGAAVSVANAGPFWMDDLGLSNSGYIGPSSLTGPPSLGHPARAPLPDQLPTRRLAGQVSSSPGAPADNPTSGPVAYPLEGPVRAPLPQLQPRAGRITSNPGAPLNDPGSGPAVYPLQGPVRSRLPQFHPRAGRVASSPGAPLHDPTAGPVFRLPVQPVRAPVPQVFSKGRTSGNPGAPVHDPTPGPPFYPLNHPAGNAFRAPGPYRKGSAQWRYGPIPPPPVFIPGAVTIARAGALATVVTVSQP